jgi:uncharacterized ion transporter superfamily protein YfcC
MKNKKLWLTLIIFTGIVFLLTWIIPSTNLDESGKLVAGSINPVGAWDIPYFATMLILWFGQSFVYIAFMAVLYGIMSKTGALRVFEDKIVLFFKKKEKWFLIISATLFILLASLTGMSFPLLVFVPLFMGIILLLGFNKITAIMSTIVPILVGTMGSLYLSSFYSVLKSYLDKGISYFWYKVCLIVAGLIIVNLYLFFTSKVEKGKEKEVIDEEKLFIEKAENKKKVKVWPIITVFSLILVIFILGFTPWANMYKLDIFSDFNTWLTGIKIGSFAVFKSIFGSTLPVLGEWTITDGTVLIAILSIVLVPIYKIKWAEAGKTAGNAVVKMLPVALIVLFANMAFILVSQSGALNTILKFFAGMTDDINVFTYSLSSFLGGALVNEDYVTSNVTWLLSTVLGGTDKLNILVFIQQIMYGLAMLIAPTSALLLAGLSYLEVEYTKWLKKIWLLFVILLAVSILVLSLVVML